MSSKVFHLLLSYYPDLGFMGLGPNASKRTLLERMQVQLNASTFSFKS